MHPCSVQQVVPYICMSKHAQDVCHKMYVHVVVEAQQYIYYTFLSCMLNFTD